VGSIPKKVIFFFSIYLFLPAHYGPGVYSSSNRNEYQKMFLGLKRGLRIRLTLPPSVSRFSRKCGSINVSKTYRPIQPVSEIALLTNRNEGVQELNP
jgi:hypothetical protein